MAAKRKSTPTKIEALILIRSRRRCCLCFFWDNDLSQVDGQLAHVDRNSSNAAEDNLAYLCLNHHNQYDSRQLQGKNISVEEIKHAREKLYERMDEPNESAINITLALARDFNSFTDADQDDLINTIREILGKNGDIVVTQRRRGSVLVTLQLNADETEQLLSAIRDGKLESQKVVDASINFELASPTEFQFGEGYKDSLLAEAFSTQHIFDVVRNPDAQQGLANGKTVPVSHASCILATKSYGSESSRRPYTALAVLGREKSSWHILSAYRVYLSEVPHSRDWEPLNLLKSFADVFGCDVEYPGTPRARVVQAQKVPFPKTIHNVNQALNFFDSIRKTYSNNPGLELHTTLCRRDSFQSHGFLELSFSILARPYALALLRNGVKVSRKYLKESPTDLL